MQRNKVRKVFFALFILYMCNSKEFIFIFHLHFVASDELWNFQVAKICCFRCFCCGWHLITWCVCGTRFMFLLIACTYTFIFEELVSCMFYWLELVKMFGHFWWYIWTRSSSDHEHLKNALGQNFLFSMYPF